MSKYCSGLDCLICNENEPCIYREADKLRQALEDIKEIAVKKNYLNLDEALDDIANKISEVLDEKI